MILIDNLQQLMRTHGNLSVSELAHLTSLPQPTLYHIFSGTTKNPRKKALEVLANYFSVTVAQLIGDEPLPNVIPEMIKEDLKISAVPIIQWDMLKSWPISIDRLGLKEILLDKKISDHSFGLVAQKSLEPQFPQNALLIFDFGKTPLDRDFVIVRRGANDQVLFNRFFTDNRGSYVKQDLDNGNANLIRLDQNIDKMMGTLIEVRIQY